MPDEPLGHVLRAAPPWRNSDNPALTECGKHPDAGMPVMTLDEFAAKLKREGQQRSAMTTCMTCWHTAVRYRSVSWAASPVAVIAREAAWGRDWNGEIRDDPSARLFRDELIAITELISRHREEFDGLVESIAVTPRLGDRRCGRECHGLCGFTRCSG